MLIGVEQNGRVGSGFGILLKMGGGVGDWKDFCVI